MGRKPQGTRAKTSTERGRKHRAEQAAQTAQQAQAL
jgi:hypothetical protein